MTPGATADARGTRAVSRSRIRFTPRAAILAVIVVGLLFYLLVPLKTYLVQRSRLDRMSHQVQLLEQQNSKLESQVRMLRDPAYLERLARQCLGMVKPGEIPFIVVPKGGSPAPPGC